MSAYALVLVVKARFGAGLVAVATALAIPRLLLNGIYLPSMPAGVSTFQPASKGLDSASELLLGLCSLLVTVQWCMPLRPIAAFFVSGLGGGVVLATLYWRYVLPTHWRQQLRAKFTRAASGSA